MGRSGKPIRKAKYVGPDYRGEIKAHEVTSRQKTLGSFYCEDCGVDLIHVSGSVPYFKLPKNKSHKPNCYYFTDIDDIEILIREVGVNNIQIKINPKNHNEVKRSETNALDTTKDAIEEKRNL